MPQRFGFLPRSFRQTGPGSIWLHAVSLGELLACQELLKLLRIEFPASRIFVSTSTLTGRETAERKLSRLADGIFFLPADYVFAVRRVLRTLRPSAVLIAETEIWPNLFREVNRTGAALAIVNARISDRAFPSYLRSRSFFSGVLTHADLILTQSDEMTRRFVEIGAPADNVHTAGNFKYDFEARTPEPGSPVLEWLERLHPSQVWIAASTTAEGGVDEDDAVIQAMLQLRATNPNLALILAPRKPERFDAVAAKLSAAGIAFWRRSRASSNAPVLLLDTVGELASLFSAADVVFMGGTLSIRGGHNVLEPALFGKPVVVGPHMENFQTIADQFHAAGAYVEIEGAEALAGAVGRLLDNPEMARHIGARALACAQADRGASQRTVAAVRQLYRDHLPLYLQALPWRPITRWLAGLWLWGGEHKRDRDLCAQRRLDLPVVSVGNITMGGSGKTPCALYLAEKLAARGRRPAFLTRGYKRDSADQDLVLAPGAPAPAEKTGDEAQILVRSGLAPVGISADRWRVGMLLRRTFDVDVMLLDDGFQHLKLARTVDLVLIDALNPFGGGAVFPAGRLREPQAGLGRADIILITRANDSDLSCAIEHALREWNRRAPIFQSFVEPCEWIAHRTGERFPLSDPPFCNPGAFCGLGNPNSFRKTLGHLGIDPAAWVEFEDHHRYRPHELNRIGRLLQAAKAESALTTEKDAVNLCEACDDLLDPLPLYWLRIAMRVDREEDFLATIAHLIR